MLGLMVALVLATLAVARPATAQSARGDAHTDPAPGRTLLIGAGVGAGLFRCSQDACGLATWALGFDVHLGRMVHPRLGLVVDGWVTSHPAQGAGVVDAIATLGPRLWLSPTLWLWGGVGLGRSCIESMLGESCELGLGFAAGVGYEIATADFFALDLEFRAGDILESEMSAPTATVMSVGLGFTWF
jgi:opacity protein-like surface antigen